MKKNIALFLSALFSFGICSPAFSQAFSKSYKLSKPVVIDGNTDEWGLPLNYYDAKTKIQFSITNDSANLYLCFVMTDPMTEGRVLRAGMEIWIDTTGKKKQQFGIVFPLVSADHAVSGEKGEVLTNDNTMPRTHGVENKALIKEKIECHLVGFKDAASNTSLNNANGIQLALGIGKLDILIYEAKIPFNTFYKNMKPADSLKDFGFTIKLNAIHTNDQAHSGGHKSENGGGSGMGRSGGGGGMNGMGRGGGGMQGGGQSRQGGGWSEMSEPTLYHTKIRLVFNR